jgi:hypothetical protein
MLGRVEVFEAAGKHQAVAPAVRRRSARTADLRALSVGACGAGVAVFEATAARAHLGATTTVTVERAPRRRRQSAARVANDAADVADVTSLLGSLLLLDRDVADIERIVFGSERPRRRRGATTTTGGVALACAVDVAQTTRQIASIASEWRRELLAPAGEAAVTGRVKDAWAALDAAVSAVSARLRRPLPQPLSSSHSLPSGPVAAASFGKPTSSRAHAVALLALGDVDGAVDHDTTDPEEEQEHGTEGDVAARDASASVADLAAIVSEAEALVRDWSLCTAPAPAPIAALWAQLVEDASPSSTAQATCAIVLASAQAQSQRVAAAEARVAAMERDALERRSRVLDALLELERRVAQSGGTAVGDA